MAGNRNPYQARMAKARKKLNSIKAADLGDGRKALSLAMIELIERIFEKPSTEDLCKLTNSLSRAVGELRVITGAVEFEERLSALEKQRKEVGARYTGATA